MNRIVIRITILLLLVMSQTAYFVHAAVLDPSVYLYPSPPFSPSSDGIEEKELWSRTSRSTKFERFTGVTSDSKETSTVISTTVDQEPMESAETFWPRLHSIDYALKPIHIPVTFSLSGSYGGYQGGLPGVISNAYANVGTGLFNYGKSALAGSGYGKYGSVRVYGGSEGSAWSGWGNGKWGHYGKG